jgi:hypothetical protein
VLDLDVEVPLFRLLQAGDLDLEKFDLLQVLCDLNIEL